MRRLLYPCFVLAITVILGCEASKPYARSQGDASLFGPAAMRIHPIFTQVKDWTNDGRPDGIEALVELQDQFGDPTKASGTIVFELFEFRQYDPEIRGQRVANPWIGDLSSMDAQRERWNRTSRTYGFQLAYPQVNENQAFVLTATFELSNGGRYFDRMILEAKEPRVVEPARTEPTTQPGQ